MTEDDARRVLLVRAWETAPRDTVRWSAEDAASASRDAARTVGESAPLDDFVARRGESAAGRITERQPRAGRSLALLRWRTWLPWAVFAAALLLGLAGDAVGSGDRINVVAPPLLGLIVWNLAVYLFTAGRALLERPVAAAGAVLAPHGPLARVVARIAHAGTAAAERAARRGATDIPAEERGEADALARFHRDWAGASAGLNGARVARILHGGAIALAVGALAGMYIRGLGIEYRAGWESTFLSAGAVESILRVLLTPASWITGIPLPDAARLEAMRFPETTGEPAAPWIHLYAVTTALLVVVPRAALAARAWFAERALSSQFPLDLDTTYFRGLRRTLGGQAVTAVVVPYNHQPSARALEGLTALLGHTLGATVAPNVTEPVGYGDEEEAATRLPAGPAPSTVVALAAATATPEAENQLVFVQALRDALPASTALITLVDESGFVARLGSDETASRRRAERRSAWRKLFAGTGIVPMSTDLERDDLDEATATLRAVLDGTGAAARPAQKL